MFPVPGDLVPKKSLIAKDYHISQRVLGVGINGKVLECTHIPTGEKYALKVSALFTLGIESDSSASWCTAKTSLTRPSCFEHFLKITHTNRMLVEKSKSVSLSRELRGQDHLEIGPVGLIVSKWLVLANLMRHGILERKHNIIPEVEAMIMTWQPSWTVLPQIMLYQLMFWNHSAFALCCTSVCSTYPKWSVQDP